MEREKGVGKGEEMDYSNPNWKKKVNLAILMDNITTYMESMYKERVRNL